MSPLRRARSRAASLTPLVSLAWLASGCPSAPSVELDAGPPDTGAATADAGTDAGAFDAGPPVDSGPIDAPDGGVLALDAGPPLDSGPRADAGAAPTTEIHPVPGEVTIVQIDLPAGLIPQTGEAAVLVGPDGTLVLLDVGNSGHDDDVRDVIEELNSTWLTPARGFPRARGLREVDWIVLSHFHSDHIGAMEDLFTGGSALDVVHGIVHRGLVDVGTGATESDYSALCDLLTVTHAELDVPLCVGASAGSCTVSATATNPATSCPGLFAGDLSDPSDDALRAPGRIDLGGGAALEFVAADAFVSDGTTAHSMSFPTSDSNEENGRSLVTIVRHGAFRYHWGGDLTGSGDPGEPDVETHLVTHAESTFYGALGMDVTHAHHHVRATSSNATFVAMAAPLDGLSRNVVGGVNEVYVLSPYPEVLARWADGARLGSGRMWLTDVAAGGGTHASLLVSGAAVIVQTTGGGTGYWVQAASASPITAGFPTLR